MPHKITSRNSQITTPTIEKIIKVNYRTFFFRHVLAKIDECDSASDVCKSVNVLVAIRWVDKAWSLVNDETIKKYFRKAGVLDSTLSVVVRDEQDPLLTVDESVLKLKELIHVTMTACSSRLFNRRICEW